MCDKETAILKLRENITQRLSMISFERDAGNTIASILELGRESTLDQKHAKMIVAEEVLNLFYEKYKLELEKHIRKYIKYDKEAPGEILQDLCQDLLGLFASNKKLNGSEDSRQISNIIGYAKTIAKNKANEYLRKSQKRKAVIDNYMQDVGASESIPESTEQVDNRELVDLMTEHIHTQKDPLPKIYDLYYLEQRSAKAISKIIKIPHNTVRAHTATIRRLLYEKFKGQF